LPINILEEALEEAAEAAGWYEKECKSLGYDFFNAVEAAFDAIEGHTFPLSPMPNEINLIDVKRLILNRFPFDIVVLEHPTKKTIIAIVHHAKKPGYWRDRITS
jgi:hypothetical protein